MRNKKLNNFYLKCFLNVLLTVDIFDSFQYFSTIPVLQECHVKRISSLMETRGVQKYLY